MYKKFFIPLFFLVFLFLSFLFQVSFSKYVLDDIRDLANLSLDFCPPEISILSVHNSNTSYETFANQNHKITLKVKITEKNLSSIFIDSNYLQVIVQDEVIVPTFESVNLVSETNNERIYEIVLTKILGNGFLSLSFIEGTVQDLSGNINKKVDFDTNIIIDNVAPTSTFQEVLLDNKMSQAHISICEPIQSILGWNLDSSKTTLTKNFTSPIKYPITVIDFAQNTSDVTISIESASAISLEYATYDVFQNIATFSNGQIAGKSTIANNSICKTEVLGVRVTGLPSYSSLLGRAFVYTHWGENSTAICKYSELTFTYGYNPNILDWYTINKQKTALFNKQFYTQFGGTSLNYPKANDLAHTNPIPEYIAKQYLYGISSVAFMFSNFPDYSIVYQTYINNYGWTKAFYDGQESIYQFNKPISGIRMNIVPKSEINTFVSYWNRDVGTNRFED